MKMSIDELDRDSLKELRGMLQDMRKAQSRTEKGRQRIRQEESVRLSFGRQAEPETPDFILR